MKLNKNSNGINSVETWKQIRPPKKEIQCKEGRSAMELARYITSALPDVPAEIEDLLSDFTDKNACFDWDAEYVTVLPGKGEGRNHDAVIYNDDVFAGIEAKADEEFGRLIGEEMICATENKINRIHSLHKLIFNGNIESHANLRYQLLTATAGTLIEAQRRGISTAVVIVLVFKSALHTEEMKLLSNSLDVYEFLESARAISYGNYWKIPTNTDINLYFKKIEISL